MNSNQEGKLFCAVVKVFMFLCLLVPKLGFGTAWSIVSTFTVLIPFIITGIIGSFLKISNPKILSIVFAIVSFYLLVN